MQISDSAMQRVASLLVRLDDTHAAHRAAQKAGKYDGADAELGHMLDQKGVAEFDGAMQMLNAILNVEPRW